MAVNLVAMAVASLLVGGAIASELSAATEARRDYTVHSHDKKVRMFFFFPVSSLRMRSFLERGKNFEW